MPSARDFLFSLEQIGIKLGLDQIRGLLDALGRPDLAFPSVIVAGTNGKGSVSAMIARGLTAAGYRTARYTSPHLVHLEERFTIDDRDVEPDAVDRTVARIITASRTLPSPPSFFEATTALAFELFRDAAVEIAVLEVGLGGRLDATNVVRPIVAAITAVDFDHEAFLGDSLEGIAREKAGVIKPGAVVVLGANPPVVVDVVADAAAAAGAPLIRAWQDVELESADVDGRNRISVSTPVGRYDNVVLGLRGRHQVQNALVAIRALEAITAQGAFAVSPAAIRAGLETVVWPARLELRAWREGAVLLDGAHNPAGARVLADYVLGTYERRLPMVVALMRDKKIDRVIEALVPAASHFIFTTPRTARAAAPADLAAAAARMAPGVPVLIREDPLTALAAASDFGSPVVVAGSLYLAGEIRAGIS